ncbi:hypothetical protein PYCCODRAFT_1002478 [Trametes coccinea BRFM310]|uniref:Uncharacterized protein n=1 Tax=Trametes coccinea (strain BRFM310) TaxID=1353009 RepID=A0A1Y2IBF1_TRAC3|nr:hypothetical protein PYCCODRAFT_1002478 [Trametes coccinea BRFM310]
MRMRSERSHHPPPTTHHGRSLARSDPGIPSVVPPPPHYTRAPRSFLLRFASAPRLISSYLISSHISRTHRSAHRSLYMLLCPIARSPARLDSLAPLASTTPTLFPPSRFAPLHRDTAEARSLRLTFACSHTRTPPHSHHQHNGQLTDSCFLDFSSVYHRDVCVRPSVRLSVWLCQWVLYSAGCRSFAEHDAVV